MKNGIKCSVCGEERPRRGKCRSCGNKLCRVCKNSMPQGRARSTCSDCGKEQDRRWGEANPEKLLAAKRKWREDNPDKQLECGRRWLETNKQRAVQATKAWQITHRLNVLAAGRKWSSAHPDKVREKCSRRRARKKGASIGPADIRSVIEASGGVCALCRSYIPEGLRHIDHIIPLDKGGPHATDNLQILCYRCNCRKGTKLPGDVPQEVWVKAVLPDQPFLLNPNWK